MSLSGSGKTENKHKGDEKGPASRNHQGWESKGGANSI